MDIMIKSFGILIGSLVTLSLGALLMKAYYDSNS
jgi:hypothetical protein